MSTTRPEPSQAAAQIPASDEAGPLPVFSERELIVSTVRSSQFVIISGATGSGKSTQIAQYILDSVLDPTLKGTIAVSQPRRVGAISLARRVAQERHTVVGDAVGYTVRFEDCTSETTQIRYVTDGCLLREVAADHLLSKYGAIVLDEAHERSLQTDILLGLVKQMAKKRPDLRVVVTSATLDLEKFSKFFDNCPTLSIPGRCYPVAINHIASMADCKFYVDAAVDLAATIHTMKPLGHILVFLTGQDEIERACALLGKKIDSLCEDNVQVPDIVILPMYGALPTSGQSRIWQRAPPGCRKVIFASNIAETSLTVPGVTYVIDTGLMKQKMFDPATGIDALTVIKISRVSATQRAGRAGRTGPGICYRLYNEEDMGGFTTETVPEIQRSSLSHTVLLLKDIGIADPLTFPFLDRPSTSTISTALCHLFYLGAIDADGHITTIGHEMARLPLDPTLALQIIKAISSGCVDEMTTIAAMASSENLWLVPPKPQQETADVAHMAFRSRYGDHVTLLFVYDEWARNDHSPSWCEANFLNGRALATARLIRRQLRETLRFPSKRAVRAKNPVSECRRIIAEVFFDRCAHRVADGLYRPYQRRRMLYHGPDTASLYSLHYQSALRYSQPKWVVYGELVAGSQGRPAMRNVTAIDIDWIKDLLPRLDQADISRLTGYSQPDKLCDPQIEKPPSSTSPPRPRSPSPRTKAARHRFEERKRQRLSIPPI